MDVDRAVEFLLESHQRAMERADAAERRMDRDEKRAEAADKRLDRIDKQLQATANLVRAGVKMIVADRIEARKSKKEFDEKLNSVIEMHRKLEQEVRRLVDVMLRKSTN